MYTYIFIFSYIYIYIGGCLHRVTGGKQSIHFYQRPFWHVRIHHHRGEKSSDADSRFLMENHELPPVQKWTLQIPWKSKDYFLNGFSVKTIVLVGIYNQQFKGTILFMVFDFQGICTEKTRNDFSNCSTFSEVIFYLDLFVRPLVVFWIFVCLGHLLMFCLKSTRFFCF